jgi:hypothetical protein
MNSTREIMQDMGSNIMLGINNISKKAIKPSLEFCLYQPTFIRKNKFLRSLFKSKVKTELSEESLENYSIYDLIHLESKESSIPLRGLSISAFTITGSGYGFALGTGLSLIATTLYSSLLDGAGDPNGLIIFSGLAPSVTNTLSGAYEYFRCIGKNMDNEKDKDLEKWFTDQL